MDYKPSISDLSLVECLVERDIARLAQFLVRRDRFVSKIERPELFLGLLEYGDRAYVVAVGEMFGWLAGCEDSPPAIAWFDSRDDAEHSFHTMATAAELVYGSSGWSVPPDGLTDRSDALDLIAKRTTPPGQGWHVPADRSR